MWALLTVEAIAQAASLVLAEVLSTIDGLLFRGGGAQAYPAQALGTAEGIFLQAKSVPDGHALPSKDAIVSVAVPSFYFYF
jgi:hypothetical protein